MKTYKYILQLSLLFSITLKIFTQNLPPESCQCPDNINILDSKDLEEEFLISKEDEIDGDISYGKRVKVSNLITF